MRSSAKNINAATRILLLDPATSSVIPIGPYLSPAFMTGQLIFWSARRTARYEPPVSPASAAVRGRKRFTRPGSCDFHQEFRKSDRPPGGNRQKLRFCPDSRLHVHLESPQREINKHHGVCRYQSSYPSTVDQRALCPGTSGWIWYCRQRSAIIFID